MLFLLKYCSNGFTIIAKSCIFACMKLHPIAYFRSSFPTKFGVPRQSGIVNELQGCIVFQPEYRIDEALRGLEGFDFLWLIWGFSANRNGDKAWYPTVRPPLLGGNKAVGVFATRSPYRPNPLGLSSVKIERIDYDAADGPVIHVLGADLMDGTPIYDIKPYLEYADSHANIRSGFVDSNKWQLLDVVFPSSLALRIPGDMLPALIKVLEQDPRPQYHDDAEKIYGMQYATFDIRFRVNGTILTVVDVLSAD